MVDRQPEFHIDIDELTAERVTGKFTELIGDSSISGYYPEITFQHQKQQLKYSLEKLPNNLTVNDLNNPGFGFSATYIAEPNQILDETLGINEVEIPYAIRTQYLEIGALQLLIRTKRRGEHRTYLKAEELLASAWQYFIQAEQKDIGILIGDWRSGDIKKGAIEVEPSDTYLDYRAELERLKTVSPTVDISDLQKQAAWTNWTGRQARKLGFTDVYVLDRPERVLAFFTKPQKAPAQASTMVK